MFNLLMFSVDWESRHVRVPLDRMFGFTDDHIEAQFRDADRKPLLDKLKELPCVFCCEGTEDEVAYVGYINEARIVGKEISLEVRFETDIPTLQNKMLYENRIELDMVRPIAFSRNNWAVKDLDLYKFLLRNVRPRRQHPTVFSIPEHENINESLISAMMPFHPSFNPVYESIREAARNLNLECRRADDIWDHSTIIQDVVSLIDRSRIVICDCTGRNPNVFYEAGIAHALGREVIIITQSEHDIPFDIQHIRHIRYLNNSEGMKNLVSQLEARMQKIIGH
ncbi:hypothetical protein ACET9H_16960 [Aeromonas media]|uniref:hypothetical protein n=1 Tax=Aeromonas media TaxID=651 RepID=UPI0038D207EB